MLRLALLIGIITLSFITTVSYANNISSAYRPLNEDWKITSNKHYISTSESTILSTAIAWDMSSLPKQQALLNTITVWPNYQIIQEQFEYLRDNKYLTDPMGIQLKRGIPWRYPLDWCFARAAAAVSLYDNHALPRPAKVFAFGNLQLLSPYGPSPDNVLSFWYHVAPIVRDQSTNQIYVLDPALNFNQPLPLENWLKQLVELSSDRQLQVNVCNGYGSTPYAVCSKATREDEKESADKVTKLLPTEWDHLQAKGINAEQLFSPAAKPPYSPMAKMIYGTISITGLPKGTALKDQLRVEYKGATETTWNTLLNVNQAIEKMQKYAYFRRHSYIPVGSIFGSTSRSAACQCDYYACACTLPNNESKLEVKISLNGNTLKQCAYQYPQEPSTINQQHFGPDIHYQFKANSSGTIEDITFGTIANC